MTDFNIESEHRKKRRRREIPPRPTHARLILDDRISSSEAWISRPLATSIGIGECERLYCSDMLTEQILRTSSNNV